MLKEKKDIKVTLRKPTAKKPKKKIPKALMADRKDICRPHYYGIYTKRQLVNN